ncbi:MAG TPA: glycosyl hydrolase family 28-related protein [Hymenobacter sp.]|uniref:glycosyl hydrolase family 28-related protein n=1 Tax=Hymenobacter sp. TaxID=1898978 RepID=UPI002D80F75B|nr:glycosyl hydrolase family 28-related protein [Hymenobacter sp.]HET9504710.1 glycosyl hydrolase family 28-related protein [Hymenobacter sp.]
MRGARAQWALAGLALLAGIVGCPPPAAAQSSYPAFTAYSMPSPAPAPPGDAFAPTMSGAAAANTPVGAEWTRTAGPDETVLLTGSRLSKYNDNSRGKDTRFKLYDGTPTLKEASVQRVDTNKTVFTLPASAAQWGMYLVWPGNESGYGQPIALNQTDAWWVGPQKATRGGTVSVYGRNLAHDNDTLSSYVYIKPAGGAGQWANVKRVNPYRVIFTVPTNLGNGDYEVWTHNGHGQQYGWSGPLKLTVYGGMQLNGPVLNVYNYGVTGNGRTDDTQGLKRALAAAKLVPGSTLYFPNGTFMISERLEISSNTRWQGQGHGSRVVCSPNFSANTDAMLFCRGENVEIRDMAFDGNHNYRGTHGDPIYLRGSKEVWITNVQFSFQDYNILELQDCLGVYVTACEFIGKTSYLGNGSQLFFNNCRFRLTNDAEMALDSWGGDGISLTNSTCQDYNPSNPADSTGWGKGRFYAGRGNFGSARGTYIGNNTSIDLAVRPIGADQNSGEQFMWEGYFTDWTGIIVSSTPTTTTLSNFSQAFASSHYAIITRGTGVGQSRRVVGYNGPTITLETPWNVPPDNTSVIALANTNDRTVMYANNLDGKAYSVTTPIHNASAGIEPYGATTNFIAANNTLHDLRIGITNWSTQNGTEPDPNFFGLFTNNKVDNCRWGILNGCYMPSPRNSNLFGATYRNNQTTNINQSAIVNIIMANNRRQVLSSFVYEHNTFQASLKGFSTGGDLGLPNGFPSQGQGIADQFFYKNAFSSPVPVSFGLKGTTGTFLRENTTSGFTQAYSASVLQGETEAPFHVLELAAAAGAAPLTTSLTLWNSGMGPLNWTASSDAAWLTLPTASGLITDERASSALALKATIGSLAAGSYSATITVTANGSMRKYLVLLQVSGTSTNPGPGTGVAIGTAVAITSPVATSGDVPGAAAISISAAVQLASGAPGVSLVEFFVDGMKVGEATANPYQCKWNAPQAGPHTLTAQVTTTDGLLTTSAPVDVTVGRRVAQKGGTGQAKTGSFLSQLAE